MRVALAARSTLLAVVLVSGSAVTATGQRYWSADLGRGNLAFEAYKPLLKQVDETFLVGAMFLNGAGRVGSNTYLEAEVPLARASVRGIADGSSIRIGNPYVGLRFGAPDKALGGRLGVRLPISSEGNGFGTAALGVGVLADFDRWEAFAPKVASARGAVELTRRSPGGLLAGLAIGSSAMISTEGGDPEVFGDYGGRIAYDGPKAYLGAELTGRILFSSQQGSLTDRTVHQLTGTLELRPGRVRPQLRVRLPLDQDYRDAVGVIVGAGVSFAF
jgi:hypothetical protein